MHELINGRQLAKRWQQRLAAEQSGIDQVLRLAIIYVGSDPVIEQFIRLKQKFGQSIGIKVVVKRFDVTVTTVKLCDEIALLAKAQDRQGGDYYAGMIVQLPLPVTLDQTAVLNSVPVDRDVDVLSSLAHENFLAGSLVLPPVVGAVREVLRHCRVDFTAKEVVVVGYGKLVGQPVSAWLRNNAIDHQIVTEDTPDAAEQIARADILILGVGKAGLITPTMIKVGVIIIDAGTSEESGSIRGDADPACQSVAAALTPVPGGIGPLTVATLFANLLHLYHDKHSGDSDSS